MLILNLNITHKADYPWQFVQDNICCLRVDSKENLYCVDVLYGDPFDYIPGTNKKPVLKRKRLSDITEMSDRTLYSGVISMDTHKLRYHFEIKMKDGSVVWLTEEGATPPLEEEQLRAFQVPYVFEKEHTAIPRWAKGFVWYQIFPDRFCNEKDNSRSASFVPLRENYYGGTFNGIRKKIGYLKELGIQGVYLNPIFSANSNHRYDTVDYASVESRLGSEQDFASLVKELHRQGLKIMLDGVFNHCSWFHPFWQDVCRNGKASSYYNWFFVYEEEKIQNITLEELTAEQMKKHPFFECFAFAANMPKWNTENPDVIEYLTEKVIYWTKQYEIDGWRLDVPDEISPLFLETLRLKLKALKPEIYIIGEIWQKANRWIRNSLFDGVMDYPLYFAIRDFSLTGEDDLRTFRKRIEKIYLSMPEAVRDSQWGFCSNHDIPRALTIAKGNINAVKKAYFLVAVLGGGISIYYGDELMMDGGDDPDNRRAMEWEKTQKKPELFSFLQELCRIKKTILGKCKWKTIWLEDDKLLYLDMQSECMRFKVILPEQDSCTISLDSKARLLFGKGKECHGKWQIENFALFGWEKE
jgi:glycosidase